MPSTCWTVRPAHRSDDNLAHQSWETLCELCRSTSVESCSKLLLVSPQRVGDAQSGVQTFRSSGSVLTRQWRRARARGGWRTCTSCTWSSCGRSTRWRHTSNEPSSTCTQETVRRTQPPRSCCCRSSTRSGEDGITYSCSPSVRSAVIVKLTTPLLFQSFPDALWWEVHVRRTETGSQNFKGETGLFNRDKKQVVHCLLLWFRQSSCLFYVSVVMPHYLLMSVRTYDLKCFSDEQTSRSYFRRNSASILKTSPGSWTVSAAANVDCGENCRWDTVCVCVCVCVGACWFLHVGMKYNMLINKL